MVRVKLDYQIWIVAGRHAPCAQTAAGSQDRRSASCNPGQNVRNRKAGRELRSDGTGARVKESRRPATEKGPEGRWSPKEPTRRARRGAPNGQFGGIWRTTSADSALTSRQRMRLIHPVRGRSPSRKAAPTPRPIVWKSEGVLHRWSLTTLNQVALAQSLRPAPFWRRLSMRPFSICQPTDGSRRLSPQRRCRHPSRHPGKLELRQNPEAGVTPRC